VNMKKYQIDPYEAVGIIAAQSLAEPTTQMTMRTFHYAGVAEHVPTGLPTFKRLVELKLGTTSPQMKPLIVIRFRPEYKDNLEIANKILKEIEYITLKDFTKMKLNLDKRKVIILIKFDEVKDYVDKKTIFDIIKKEIEKHVGKNLKFVENEEKGLLIKFSSKIERRKIYNIFIKLPSIPVNGIQGIRRAVISRENDENIIKAVITPEYKENPLKIIINKYKEFIDPYKIYTNSRELIYNMFGIEGLRNILLMEAKNIYDTQGLDIDIRHISLLLDYMTFTGKLLPLKAEYIIKHKSVLAQAAYERAVSVLIDAAVRGRKDELQGIVERNLVGLPINIGTGRIILKYKGDK